MAACAERGVTVCNVRDWSRSVPEHVFALILSLGGQLPSSGRAVAAGRWQASPTYGLLLEPLPITLEGTTLGVIGHGALGQRVVALGQAFGMQTLIAEHKGAADLRAGRTPFEQVLAESHVLVILCPLNADTRGMIGAPELARMRRDALLINCARGGIVDVLSEEPPTRGNPLFGLDVPNLIVTPHLAFASVPSLEALAEQRIGNLEAFVAHQPRNLISP